jgi:hypothetical protein
MKGRSFFVLAVGLLPMFGCDLIDITAPAERQAVTGSWVGAIESFSRSGLAGSTGPEIVEVLLTEEPPGRIAGVGSIRQTRTGTAGSLSSGGRTVASRAFEADGVNVYPEVAITLRPGTDPRVSTELILFRGEFVGRHVLSGRLNGGGYNNVRLRLRRDRTLPKG